MLKLGVIGMSPGNGHPYSWSAIFNGYEESYMKDCPFPIIPKYLSERSFPQDSIKDASVTHIWTQSKSLSEHISKATNIHNIVNDYEEMIGEVDAILLARDDYESHYKFSKAFLEAGLPIYIDKPLAISLKCANKLYDLEKYKNQIFTCSALKYAKEFTLTEKDIIKVGKIKSIDAFVIKDWEKYGIHIVEPVLSILGNQGDIDNYVVLEKADREIREITWSTGVITTFNNMKEIKAPIRIIVNGERDTIELVFKDTFYSFKEALEDFVRAVRRKPNSYSQDFVLKVIDVIERGRLIGK